MDMNLRTKLGQKFVIGFTGTEVTEELRAVMKQYPFGNFILFRDNLVSPAQTRALCRELHGLALEATGVAPFISIDQEGGMVTRLADDDLNIPGAMALASTGDLELTRELNRLNGDQLRGLGVNLNLAPVFDINSEPDNPVIGVRSYGDDPAQVSIAARASYEGLKASGVLGAAKHFPGHGDTKVDSHVGLPRVDVDRRTLDTRELVPFREAIDADIDAIMTTHILFPVLEEKRIPATMSRAIITGLLREELGYKGLIISDCMEMDAIAEHYGTVEGVREAFGAGVDLVFVSHTLTLATEAFDHAYEAYTSGQLTQAELDESVNRIMKVKREMPEFAPADNADHDALTKDTIQAVLPRTFCALPEAADLSSFRGDGSTVVLGPAPYRATNVSNVNGGAMSFAGDLGRALGVLSMETSARPTEDEIAKVVSATDHADRIILGLYNGHVFTEQLQLWKALRREGRKILLVALRNPYDLMYLEDGEIGLAIYEYTAKSLVALANCMTGEAEATGRMPVELPRRTIE